MTKTIETIADLQRAWNARNRQAARLRKRPYILQPALAHHLAQLEGLEKITDKASRYQAFRRLPALEFELEAVDRSLTPQERVSLAQQDRASHPRVHLTPDGQTLEAVIFELLTRDDNPWEKKAKQYWGPLVDRLRQLGLNPTLQSDLAHPSKDKLVYDCNGNRRTLTLGQFHNIVSTVRRRLSRRLS